MQKLKSFLGKMIRKWYFWVIAFFVLIMMIGASTDPVKVEPKAAPAIQTEVQQVVESSEHQLTQDQPTVIATGSSSQTVPAPTPVTLTPTSQYTYYSVVSVTDGDTLKISMNGSTETLRLIGIDTPETVDPRKPVQCFGKEASSKAKELLTGKKVRIEADASQDTRDKYGRLLVYIYRDDGLFYNKYMIEQGYAHEYTYQTPYKYQAEFKAAQKTAEANQLGLWSPNTCNGDTTVAASSSITPATPPATTASSGKFYTSSYSTSKYYYPESCDGWKSLNANYLKSFDTLDALLAAYPSRTLSSSCQ